MSEQKMANLDTEKAQPLGDTGDGQTGVPNSEQGISNRAGDKAATGDDEDEVDDDEEDDGDEVDEDDDDESDEDEDLDELDEEGNPEAGSKTPS